MIYLLLNKLAFRPHSGPRFTRAIALAQNQLSKRTCFRHAVPVIEGNRCSLNHAGAVSSALRFSNRMCPKETVLGSVYRWSENCCKPILDSRTRTALTGTLHAHSVYQLLCSCSSSVLFHTNSTCECVIINYNYITAHKSSLIPISLNHGPTSLTKNPLACNLT